VWGVLRLPRVDGEVDIFSDAFVAVAVVTGGILPVEAEQTDCFCLEGFGESDNQHGGGDGDRAVFPAFDHVVVDYVVVGGEIVDL